MLNGSPYGKKRTIIVTSRLLFRTSTAYNKAYRGKINKNEK